MYQIFFMKKEPLERRVIRIIDVNANRLTEGLRVCEEIARFVLDDIAATRRFKTLRHRVFSAVKELGVDKELLLKSRDSDNDIGKMSIKDERRRNDIADIFKANITRSEESIRVLEEFAKLSSAAIADKFKKIRFELYFLEKAVIEKL
jgi:thiamine-phosphate pyrophosphorylase